MNWAGRAAGQDYYGLERADVLSMVPVGVTRVLSIGCGAGRTEAKLRERGARVTGIEVVPEAAEAAREVLDEVVTADIEAMDPLPWKAGDFDCVVCADVLEHLREPERVLHRAWDLLAPGGWLVLSVPNARHWHVLWELVVRGDFPYADAGLFDRTHLRMFTVKSTLRMVETAGFDVTATREKLIYPRYVTYVAAALGRVFRCVREMMVHQFLLTARKRDTT